MIANQPLLCLFPYFVKDITLQLILFSKIFQFCVCSAGTRTILQVFHLKEIKDLQRMADEFVF